MTTPLRFRRAVPLAGLCDKAHKPEALIVRQAAYGDGLAARNSCCRADDATQFDAWKAARNRVYRSERTGLGRHPSWTENSREESAERQLRLHLVPRLTAVITRRR